MDNPETFYLAASDYRTQSKVPTLVSKLSQGEVESLLLETMGEIDAYLGGGWTPFTDGQEFTFPRDRDTDAVGNAVIPRCVATATRMIADAKTRLDRTGVLPHDVVSEGGLGRTYTKRARAAAEPGFEHWPPEAFVQLSRIPRHFGGELAVDGAW